MTYPTSQVPAGRPPEWRVWSPQRLGDFHWLIIPQRWFDSRDPLLDSILNFVYGAVLIVEVVLLVPTAGPIRLIIHHVRSPGWYVECRYGIALERPTDPRVELQTRTKRQAKRVKRALRREFRNGADFNSAAVQAAFARNEAVFRPTTPPPPVVSGTN
jgi:hypothetical protein